MKIRFSVFALIALAVVLPLSSCDKGNNAVRPGETSILTESGENAGGETSGTLVKDGKRWTITSLDDWAEFDYDGNFSDNCFAFLRQLIEGESEFSEFQTLKISDYKLVRDEEEYGLPCLYFEFTVTESGIDALPVGHHTAILTDTVDCFFRMTDTGTGAENTEAEFPFKDNPYAAAVCDWIDSRYRWGLPEYGTAAVEEIVPYLTERYGGEDQTLFYDDFAALAKDKFGVAVTKESASDFLDVKDGKLCVVAGDAPNGLCNYVVTDVSEADGKVEVTVQFFADCNSFFRSQKTVYTLGKDERMYGCSVVTKSPYRPYGLRQ